MISIRADGLGSMRHRVINTNACEPGATAENRVTVTFLFVWIPHHDSALCPTLRSRISIVRPQQ